MNEKQLAACIPVRKSVRSFEETSLSAEILSDIINFARSITPLFATINTAIQIIPRRDVKSFGSLFAPQYLAFYSEKNPDSDLNCGFILQQVELYISSKGLGSCWLGMTKPVKQEYNGLPFSILLAFGISGDAVHRASQDLFRRKSLSDIASPDAVPAYISQVRLAPSAMNKQPWFFAGDSRSCHAFSVHGKSLLNLAGGLRYVDLGIALAHLYVAATADGKKVSFRREDSIPSRSGSEYVISCRIE